MKKPLIGITTGLFTVETGVFAGMERVYVNRDYVDAVERAGGIPLLCLLWKMKRHKLILPLCVTDSFFRGE